MRISSFTLIIFIITIAVASVVVASIFNIHLTTIVVPGGGKAMALPYSMGLCLPGDTTDFEWSRCMMDGGREDYHSNYYTTNYCC